MKKQGSIFTIIFMMVLTVMSCKSNSETTNNTSQARQGDQRQRPQQGQRQGGGERPDASQLILEMDADKDGKLSKEEAKGPIANDFSKIDANEDGYLTKEEIEKAPKPQRRGRN